MTVRLTYFDFPFWRAEVSRLALHIGGVPFEDVRPTREEFRQAKAQGAYPYGQLPILEVDGVMIAQSAAIAVYCGKLSGLYPSDDALAAARVDELLAAANQVTNLVSITMRESDAAARAAQRAVLASDTLPIWLERIEKRLAEGGAGPFFVGEALTVADLAWWRLLGRLTGGILDGIPTNLVSPFPGLSRLVQAVGEREDVRVWMARYDAPKA